MIEEIIARDPLITTVPFPLLCDKAAGLGRRLIHDLESEIDEYGNELFVESRSDQDRRRAVWYSVCKRSGRTRRRQGKFHGTQTEIVSDSQRLPKLE